MATADLTETEDFGALFEESLKKKRKTVQPGERVKATVMTVGERRVLLDLGDGLDGMMELSELAEPGEKPTVKTGDVVEAYVLSVENRMAVLGKAAGKGAGARRALEDSAATGLPVEGTVLEVNKGGYVVDVGGTRCFCPLAQMDIRRIEDPATMVGQKLLFKVTEFKGSRDVVVSRRAFLEVEQAQKAAEIRGKLVVGAVLRGKVSGLRDFGAFVDLGGIDGLVPVSELGYGRLKPQDLLRIGQEVDVEIQRIEPGKDGKGERISLSMRALADDPMETAFDQLPRGLVLLGKVTRTQPFGAFIELSPGVEGLLHVSAFGRRVGHPSEVVKPEETIAVRVDNVDREQRRISLAYFSKEDVEKQGWAMPAQLGPATPVKADAKADTKGAVIHRKAEKTDAAPAAANAGGLVILGRVELPAEEPVDPTKAGAQEKGGNRRPTFGPPKVGAMFDVTVDRIEPYGVFVKWDTGRGLVPGSELGTQRNADLKKAFPPGTVFKAVVEEVRPDGKVRLSKTAVERAEERADAAAYMQSSGVAGTGFGTLGDLFKKVKVSK